MNYYERYCGDYQRDTAHLSLAEHGAYTMLLDTYFSVEKPLPEDLPSLYRVCRAMTRLEQQAVKAVAEQFFPVSEGDGLRHNPRADREIAKARPKIEAARINGRKGGRPPKASGMNVENRRVQPGGAANIPAGLSAGFDQQTGEGMPAVFIETHDKPGSEARLFQLQHQPHHQHEPHHQPCQPREEASADFKPGEMSFPEKGRPELETTAHGQRQEPDLDHGDPYSHPGNSDNGAHFHAGIGGPESSIARGTSGACCKALMSQGVTGCNPHHPTLLALLQAGATVEEFLQAARNAASRGKANFSYVVGMVKRQREEAAKLVLHRGRMPNSQELLQAANHSGTAGWMPPELWNSRPAEAVDKRGVESSETDGRFSPCA
jgi:uncharacterized protein YdaU (DUF1376 family)